MAYSPFSQKQVAPIRSSDHLRRPVRHRRRSELLSHRLHTASQWELWTPADFTGAHSQGHLQVYGHFHHGVCGLHDRHVQPLLILPRSKVQPCLHHVSFTWLSEWSSMCWENVCDYVWSDYLSISETLSLSLLQNFSEIWCSILKHNPALIILHKTAKGKKQIC